MLLRTRISGNVQLGSQCFSSFAGHANWVSRQQQAIFSFLDYSRRYWHILNSHLPCIKFLIIHTHTYLEISIQHEIHEGCRLRTSVLRSYTLVAYKQDIVASSFHEVAKIAALKTEVYILHHIRFLSIPRIIYDQLALTHKISNWHITSMIIKKILIHDLSKTFFCSYLSLRVSESEFYRESSMVKTQNMSC